MTRKDYVALARALNYSQPGPIWVAIGITTWTVWRASVDAIADVLAADNPRFDRERFVRACEGGK